MSSSKVTHGGWIGVDLDGTLAFYDGWKGADHIGSPISPMVERIKRWLGQGIEVRIFTARVSGPPEEAMVVRKYIQNWLVNWGLPALEVTNVKDYSMWELWDDRAVRVVANTGSSVEELIARTAKEFGSTA